MVNSTQSLEDGCSTTATNGHPVLQDGSNETPQGNFLFTSESVGEGHPGTFNLNWFELIFRSKLKFYRLFSN